MTKIYYAGIGSRDVPEDVYNTFYELAGLLYANGFTLRSGGANGSDTAFEAGTPDDPDTQIFLPKDGFNGRLGDFTSPSQNAIRVAEEHHPAWKNIRSDMAKKLLSRNTHQILGPDVIYPEDYSSFVVCWTPDGAEHTKRTSRATGGTGQAIRVATTHRIPVFNFFNNDAYDRLMHHLNLFYDVDLIN